MKSLPVNGVNDDTALEKQVEDEIGRKVRLDPENAKTEDPQSLSPNVPAVLLKLNGGAGQVRGPGNFVVQTGPSEAKEYRIIIRNNGEKCALLGKPSVRLFRLLS